MDHAKIGNLAAEARKELEEAMPNGEIGSVCLIVEATAPETPSTIVVKSSDPRTHVMLGMLETARLSVIGQRLDGQGRARAGDDGRGGGRQTWPRSSRLVSFLRP
jgi:hypothetical protein